MSDAFERLLRTKLDPLDAVADESARTRSDNDLNPDWDNHPEQRPAAVLAPIIKRPEGWTMLFTERSVETPAHPGQISFPGGRVQASDASAVETALRETMEEIGLERRFIEPLGAWDRYDTITGYRVTPIVGLVEPGFTLTLDPREVARVFEAPLDFLFDPANHEKRQAQWQGRTRYYYAMPYGDHFIWGATAGMIRALWERLYA
ncbi:MAG TPA: CoA pyrophosphatase [Vitreimonas sp.]|uniref:CoA pyrophosphatase n=1 Tax=Vitreimonas sp. TaxID=3069702 RepID=UPI002D645804|nr:CoA pyrophosphatase [Vitreimonas sp.]HYD87880.1 CoA pyrophosphatase [Vitreimonas sp.]